MHLCKSLFNIFKQNRIILISSRLTKFWCFGLPAALGRRQVGEGVSGGMGVSPHACTHMYTHVYIYRNLQISADMEESMFIIFTTCMYMHACMCAGMGHPPHTHTHPHSHPPIPHLQGVPRISKNLITLELIKII